MFKLLCMNPKKIDASGNLVGQIRNHENSAQLIFPHDDDDVGEEFAEYLCRLANQYMDYVESDAVTDTHGEEVNRSITGNEKKYNPIGNIIETPESNIPAIL